MIFLHVLCLCLLTTTSGNNVVNVKLCVNCDSTAYTAGKTGPNLLNYYLKTPTTTQDPVDMCFGVTCSNGGICVGGTCVCVDGFTGAMCENPVDLCTGVTCENGGACIMGTCKCAAGFTGIRCEILENACNSMPCMNGGTCQVTGGFWMCQCPIVFGGIDCSVNRLKTSV